MPRERKEESYKREEPCPSRERRGGIRKGEGQRRKAAARVAPGPKSKVGEATRERDSVQREERRQLQGKVRPRVRKEESHKRGAKSKEGGRKPQGRGKAPREERRQPQKRSSASREGGRKLQDRGTALRERKEESYKTGAMHRERKGGESCKGGAWPRERKEESYKGGATPRERGRTTNRGGQGPEQRRKKVT